MEKDIKLKKTRKFKKHDIWICDISKRELIEIKETTKESIRTKYGWYSSLEFNKMAIEKYGYQKYWGIIPLWKVKMLED